MPTAPTYPGVYIEEIPSGVRTITGVATSITAFLGNASRGPVNDPTIINNFADYERRFGGLSIDSTMSYAVRDFYLNGGSRAVIVRLTSNDAAVASLTLSASGGGSLVLEASSVGSWGNRVRAKVDHRTKDPGNLNLFNLTVREEIGEEGGVPEKFFNVSIDPNDSRYLPRVLEQGSLLVRVQQSGGNFSMPTTGRPDRTLSSPPIRPPSSPPNFDEAFLPFT